MDRITQTHMALLIVGIISINPPQSSLTIRIAPETLECTPELAIQYLDYFIPTESLEQISEETPEAMSDQGALSRLYDEQLDANDLSYLVRQELSTLKPRERRIIYLRYGFEDGIAHTLEEVGAEYGLTRERIRQIEAKVIHKLQHPSHRKHLKDFW